MFEEIRRSLRLKILNEKEEKHEAIKVSVGVENNLMCIRFNKKIGTLYLTKEQLGEFLSNLASNSIKLT